MLVEFLKIIAPVAELPAPRVREELPVKVAVLNWGEAEVLIFWIVLTAPLLTEKLVALKLAIPLVPVVASFIVTVEPAPEALAIERAPVKPLRLVTPPWAARQLPQDKVLVPSVLRH